MTEHPARTEPSKSGPQSGSQAGTQPGPEPVDAVPEASQASADQAGAAAPTDPQPVSAEAPSADAGSAPGPVAATPVVSTAGDDDETVVPVGAALADRPDPAGSCVSTAGPDGDGVPGPVAQQDCAPAADPATAPGALPAVPSPDPTPEQGDPTPEQGVASGHPAGQELAVQASAAPVLPPWRRVSSAGALILVLIALFGFTLVVQLRSNDTDQGLATARQEDLVRILSDLDAREQRLADEITTLEASRRQLTSGVQGRQVALQEAEKRANELGLLAGTLPARGPGLLIAITPGKDPIKASAILNTVQELRGAGGEVMALAGADGTTVRVVASTSFVDSGGSVTVDGVRLSGPYQLTVIGDPQTMKTALNIPGGVVASVGGAGGTVIPLDRTTVDVTAVRKATTLQYARPVS
jgi:uncharacterized protein YlxW (UPF0749 family)